MAVRIRLSRGGSKKRPFYRIVVADSRSPRDGRFIERLGSYNPLLPAESAERVVLDIEKTKSWLAKGALPTDRLEKVLSKLGLCAAPCYAAQTKQAEPRAKAQERIKEKEAKALEKIEAEKMAAEKAKEEAAAAKAAAEAPVVEVVAETEQESA